MHTDTLQDYPQKMLSFEFCITPFEQKVLKNQGSKKRKVICIAGPTGTGKTALSLLLAQDLKGCQIISADSMQVYRGMDIGTAKIKKEEQLGIPHHLIDIRHITESFNVVDFYYAARSCIESILAAGQIPIVVGGAGFYYRALLYGPPDGPPSISLVREELEAEMDVLGTLALYNRLQILDPLYASSITHNDRHKIIRALEIISLTQQPVSKFAWKRRYLSLDYDFHCWFVYRPREFLYKILEDRCEKMVTGGFVEEVEKLKAIGLCNNPSACQAIGYKQCLEYLNSARTEADFDLFLNQFKISSRHYAKKQFTWFRKEQTFRWLNVELHDMETAMEMIKQDYLNC